MSNERKKQRRLERHQRNIRKEREYKESAWENGKLIEENHNGKPYSQQYTKDLEVRLYNIMTGIRLKLSEHPDDKSGYAIFRFRAYRKKIQDYILLHNPGEPKTEAYEYLKNLLEYYWDNPEDLWKQL